MPTAGVTHDAVLKYNTHASPLYVGLMLVKPPVQYSQKIYPPFAPKTREGEARTRDFSFLNHSTLISDWSGGTGSLIEGMAQPNTYASAFGSPCLFTGRRGRLICPPQVVTIDTARKDIIGFIECQFASPLYLAWSNASPGLVYKFDSTGTTLTDTSAGLTVAIKQMFFDGTKVYATQGTANAVRSSSDATTWANEAYNADFVAQREGAVMCYVGLNGSNKAYFTPGGSEGYSAVNIGWVGTIATNMMFYNGSIYFGKPEGLYRWTGGRQEQFFDTSQFYSTSNCSKMAIYNGLLFFNVGGRLFFTNGQKVQEYYKEDLNGFISIEFLSSTFGTLLMGVHINEAIGSSYTEKSLLTMFGGPSDPGLNPLMATANTTVAQAKSPGTLADDATAGTVEWTNPTNASSADDTYATATSSGAATTHYLKATNFSFSVPSTATIVGVAVEVEWKLASNPVDVSLYAKLVKGGTVSGNAVLAPVVRGTAERRDILGSASSLWGLSLTPTDINASNFGVVVYGTTLGINTFSVDFVRVTVYFSIGINNYAAAGSTSMFDSTGNRVYLCESDSTNGLGVRYLNLNKRFQPLSYDTQPSALQYIDLTETDFGFPLVNKWGHAFVVSCRNPNSTTFCRVDYSTDGGQTFTQTLDTAGTATELTLSALNQACYLPLSTTFTRIQPRIYLRTTDASTAAEDIAITLINLLEPKVLYRFDMQIQAQETVVPLQGPNENGAAIRAAVFAAKAQGYPIDFQDIRQQWHRCDFINTPEEVNYELVPQTGGMPQKIFSDIVIALGEIEPLSSSGELQAWSST